MGKTAQRALTHRGKRFASREKCVTVALTVEKETRAQREPSKTAGNVNSLTQDLTRTSESENRVRNVQQKSENVSYSFRVHIGIKVS